MRERKWGEREGGRERRREGERERERKKERERGSEREREAAALNRSITNETCDRSLFDA